MKISLKKIFSHYPLWLFCIVLLLSPLTSGTVHACAQDSDCDPIGWYNTGDSGPGCLDTNDPVAELRDYWCDLGSSTCVYDVLSSNDCNTFDAWTGGGDAGCGVFDDPTAQQRDYYANSGGICVYTLVNCDPTDCDGQDGWYGGGDSADCGDDPASLRRDYFFNSGTGTCEYCETGESTDCDSSDICGVPVCEGTAIKGYTDYFVSPDSNSCTFTNGPVVEDCAARDSTDSDSGAEYTTGGYVTDYTGCASAECVSSGHYDYCTGNTLTEYAADGASYTTSEKDCEDYSATFCSDNELYAETWQCSGSPGFCNDSGADTLVEDCSLRSGWYCVDTQSEYHTYTCGSGACSFSITDSGGACFDITGDGLVDIFDLARVSASYGRSVGDGGTPAWNTQGDGSEADIADINDDGVVDDDDVTLMSDHFGEELL